MRATEEDTVERLVDARAQRWVIKAFVGVFSVLALAGVFMNYWIDLKIEGRMLQMQMMIRKQIDDSLIESRRATQVTARVVTDLHTRVSVLENKP